MNLSTKVTLSMECLQENRDVAKDIYLWYLYHLFFLRLLFFLMCVHNVSGLFCYYTDKSRSPLVCKPRVQRAVRGFIVLVESDKSLVVNRLSASGGWENNDLRTGRRAHCKMSTGCWTYSSAEFLHREKLNFAVSFNGVNGVRGKYTVENDIAAVDWLETMPNGTRTIKSGMRNKVSLAEYIFRRCTDWRDEKKNQTKLTSALKFAREFTIKISNRDACARYNCTWKYRRIFLRGNHW